jgi:UDP-glucuronate decarboxylase
VGNNKEISVLDLAKLILKKTNSKSKIIYLPPREEDPKRRAADITKIKKLLNWSPKITLEEGLERTINWLKEKNNL